MRLGMPTLIECESLEENAALCKELDLDFIELNMNIPIFTPECMHAEHIHKLKAKYNIDFTIHLPEEMDLASFQPSIREGHVQRCKQVIEWAREAGIGVLNMHLNHGIYFTLPDKKVWIYEKYEKPFIELLIQSYAEILEHAKKHAVLVCTENTRNFHIPFVHRALIELEQRFDNFFLTWDVGHDARGNYEELPFFMDHSSLVKHMHLHDCIDDQDHLPLFSGTVPILERLKLAEENDLSVVIEIKTSDALRDSVSCLRKYFRE